jgi:NifU-like protein involved in Fe-S cluster formation
MKMNDNSQYRHFGRMNDPTASAWIDGICGDQMEFYLYIRNNILEEVKFYTENGCEDTKAAGEKVAYLAEKKDVMDALSVNPKQILEALDYFSREKSQITENGRHCAILAVSTLYKALADFLLRK